jgi:hypothetical protein
MTDVVHCSDDGDVCDYCEGRDLGYMEGFDVGFIEGRLAAAQLIRDFRIGTEPLITDRETAYLTGLLRAEIIATGEPTNVAP